MNKPLVAIVMGSDSDLPIVENALKVLKSFSIPYEVIISSAHRSPKKTSDFSKNAADRGLEVIIAAAGFAAHLAGVIASETTLPVIGIPIDSSPLNGMDALLSTVQMPGGIPVAAMSIGKAGATNAAVFAAQILALKYPEINNNLKTYRKELENKVELKSKALNEKLGIA